MNHSRVFRSSLHFASAVRGVAVVTAAAPSAAEDVKVRWGGDGAKSVATCEFLEDITITLEAGAPSSLVEQAIEVTLPGVVSNLALGMRYGITPTPSLLLDGQFTPTSTLEHVNGPHANVGDDSGISSADVDINTTGPNFIYGTFQAGGFSPFSRPCTCSRTISRPRDVPVRRSREIRASRP